MMSGRDTVAQAQSGTGKTCACAIGILQRIVMDNKECQGQPTFVVVFLLLFLSHDLMFVAIVLSSSRSLVQHSVRDIKALGDFLKVTIHACVGASSTRLEREIIGKGVQVVVGTPGRVFDYIKSGALRTAQLRLCILDEADELMSKGFYDSVYDVMQELPREVQVCLFSATMPKEVLALEAKLMRTPVRILMKTEQTLAGIKQYYIAVEKEEWKLETLIDLYETTVMKITQSIVYANSRSHMHGDMCDADREAVMRKFRSQTARILVTTDGDVMQHDVPLILNWDLPLVKENYLHRVACCARFGIGVTINFITTEVFFIIFLPWLLYLLTFLFLYMLLLQDVGAMHEIEKFYHIQINEMPMDVAT
jgi:translation initiation factor 4A